MMDQFIVKFCDSIIDHGPGMVIAIVILYGVYKLFKALGLRFVSSMEDQAKALTIQADSMKTLTGSLQDYVGRDQGEHREIIILQKVILGKLERLGQEDETTEHAALRMRLKKETPGD